MENFEYLITSIDLSDLRNMLFQKCTMRDTFLKGKMFWKVISGDKIEDDLCLKIEKESIDLSLLPNEGAFYKKIFQEDDDYIQQIESEYPNDLTFNNIKN